MNELSKTAGVLADPTRVRILAALLEGELCVCELCDVLEVTQSTLSTHLKVVRDAGLVSARKQGKWMYYDFSSDGRAAIAPLFKLFETPLKRDPELRRDSKRLGRRLAMREDGSCCVGFADGFGKKGCSP